MSPTLHLRAAILAANLVVMLAVSRPALAAEVSQWDGDQRAAVRLIAGATRGTTHHGGVEIRLAPGWKTYWRYPGDSGVPPRFDFSASRNVKTVTVRYPAPQRLKDESGVSIGYKSNVVFPLDIVPEEAGKPVVLNLKIDYAICEKICIPAEGKAELTMTGKPGASNGALDDSEKLLPSSGAIGGNEALAVRAVKREDRRILVDVAAPAGAQTDLFAEGPTPDWALPVPTPIDGAPAGQQRFVFELDGLPPNTAASGAILRLTAVAGEQAIEVPYRLD